MGALLQVRSLPRQGQERDRSRTVHCKRSNPGPRRTYQRHQHRGRRHRIYLLAQQSIIAAKFQPAGSVKPGSLILSLLLRTQRAKLFTTTDFRSVIQHRLYAGIVHIFCVHPYKSGIYLSFISDFKNCSRRRYDCRVSHPERILYDKSVNAAV